MSSILSGLAPPGTLIFDADCGICVATATWLGRRVTPRRLALLAIAEAETGSDPRIASLVKGRPLTSTIHFVRPDDRVVTGARAILAAGRLVPRWRLLAGFVDNRVGHVLLEPIYRQIAAHRRRIGRMLGLPLVCPLPRQEDRPA